MFLDRICKRESCSKPFTTEDKRQKYCCIQCAYKDRPSNKIKMSCEYCNKDIYIFRSRNDGRHHFCSEECQNNWQKHFHSGCGNPQWSGSCLARVCEYCKKTYKPNKSRNSKFCSLSCHLSNLTEYQQQEHHPKWKGGVTTGRRKLELEVKYQDWRMSVYKRDDFRCVVCGSFQNICAHHIKTFADYPELRSIVSNGITLCQKHHLETYGKEPLYEDRFYAMLEVANA